MPAQLLVRRRSGSDASSISSLEGDPFAAIAVGVYPLLAAATDDGSDDLSWNSHSHGRVAGSIQFGGSSSNTERFNIPPPPAAPLLVEGFDNNDDGVGNFSLDDDENEKIQGNLAMPSPPSHSERRAFPIVKLVDDSIPQSSSSTSGETIRPSATSSSSRSALSAQLSQHGSPSHIASAAAPSSFSNNSSKLEASEENDALGPMPSSPPNHNNLPLKGASLSSSPASYGSILRSSAPPTPAAAASTSKSERRQSFPFSSSLTFTPHRPEMQHTTSSQSAPMRRASTYASTSYSYTNADGPRRGRSKTRTDSMSTAHRSYPAVFRKMESESAQLRTDENGDRETLYHRAGLVDKQSGQYEEFRKSDEELKGIKNKKVRAFYEGQNAILDMFREVDELLDGTPVIAFEEEGGEGAGETAALLPQYSAQGNGNGNGKGDVEEGGKSGQKGGETSDERLARRTKWFVNLNLGINIILLTGKILVVLLSNSISLLASVIDSGMDLLSTVILFFAAKMIENRDWKRRYAYPVGLRRAEPMGVVVFSVFMIASFVQVFIESIERLVAAISDPDAEVVTIPLSGVLVMVATIVVKFFLWWGSRGSKSSTVRALSQDAENDVVFNTMSLVFPFVGQKLGTSWLDPLGGLVLSLYIVVEWLKTLTQNIRQLMGMRRGPDEHQRVAYLVTRFSPHIIALEHVDVYASGDQCIAEVDIVLPADSPLPMSHNVGESVQYALENLSGIERAYCHIDFNPNNPSGHVER